MPTGTMLRAAAALGVALALGALSGCAPTSRPVLLEAAPIPPSQESQWEKYGAYYVYDEVFVEETFLDGGQFSRPPGSIFVNKQLKILTREGVQHGSIEVRSFGTGIARVRLAAYDSAGLAMKLDTSALMAGYRKNGRFIFSHLGKYDYDFAEYGPVRKSSARMQKQTGKLIYRTWEVADILPRGRLDYQEDIDAAEPRVSAVMRSFNGFPVISDWEGLGRKYQEVAFKPSFFNSTRKLKAKADELYKGQAAREMRALYPRIVELNRISEGRLVVRGEGGKKSANGGK